MHFDDGYLGSLPDDLKEVVRLVIRRFDELELASAQKDEADLDGYVRAAAALQAVVKANDIKDLELAPPREGRAEFVDSVRESFNRAREWLLRGSLGQLVTQDSERYQKMMAADRYEFPEADYARLQAILDGLRDLIPASGAIPDEDKGRLSKALGAFEAMVHRRVSDLDPLIGRGLGLYARLKPFAADAAEALREVYAILWRGKVTKDGLPAGSSPPLLPAPDEPQAPVSSRPTLRVGWRCGKCGQMTQEPFCAECGTPAPGGES